MKRWHLLTGLLLLAVLFVAPAAYADVYETYNLAWSGATYGNSASATGQITLDLTTLPNPVGNTQVEIYGSIQSLVVTISGASSGNGTWTKGDLQQLSSFGTYTYWSTGGGTLNMGIGLIGQPTTGNPWGTSDAISGDFNLFFGNGGPLGFYYFSMSTNGGSGDGLLLTKFSPTSVTPEPGTMLLLGTGLAGLTRMVRRKLGQRA